MSEDKQLKVQAAAITDRGLSEKRPLNEDSFLADEKRGIFAVADGVGGAQAGEVASQTAMEVLDEAFRHQEEDADIEDLMEIAIQRANNSIFRMSREHPKLSMMATTIVALHLNGKIATIGHVGDSRLYRLKPDGNLQRETIDHSIVEEEVQAGRMTRAQAASHPSRNVISRAVGAEEGVEVDLKTIEIEGGTTFLLCSDGITRHVSDEEIRELLSGAQELQAICEELKRRCYERGAEDNLTAVIVRVGDYIPKLAPLSEDDEKTIIRERPQHNGNDDEHAAKAPQQDFNITMMAKPVGPDAASAPPAPPLFQPAQTQSAQPVTPRNGRSKGGSFATLLSLLFLALLPVAFYFGMIYDKRRVVPTFQQSNMSAATPAPTVDSIAEFERRRREVDREPARMVTQLETENGGRPQDSNDPQVLYLFGRALLLSGRYQDSSAAFGKAAELLKDRPSRDPLKVETKLSAAVAALKSENQAAIQTAAKDIEEVIETQSKSKLEAGSASSGGQNATDANSNAQATPAPSQQ